MSRSISRWLCLLILCVYVVSLFSFPADEIPKESETKSNSDISFEAFFNATAKFLERKQLVNYTGQSPFFMVSKYFGSENLRQYEAVKMSFTTTNTGKSPLDFFVAISDGHSDPRVRRVSLNGGQVYSGDVIVIRKAIITFSLHLAVTLQNHSGNIQTEKRQYYVTNTHTADCTTNKSPNSCPLDSCTTEKCTYYRNELVQVLSTTVKESTIENLNDEVMLDYGIFADGNFSLSIQISFPANDFLKDTGTESHGVITLEAIYIATATFLDRMQLVNDTRKSPGLKVFEYFGTDQESKQQFTKIIHEISGYESIVQRDKADKSFFHVYGEQIQIGHFLIKNIRSKIKDLSRNKTIVKANISFIRELVATILYIIQEFYRNTNWIDLHGNTIYKDFGQDNVSLAAVAGLRDKTCINCRYVNGMKHFENNTVGLNLNSGHRSVQNVTKPINSLSNESGSKCNHGTRDASRNLKAIGGTFKESSNQHETPHSHLHIVAAEAAVKATVYYLVDADRGLLKLVGPDVFRDIFGIHSREEIVKTSLTFVIDVTGSISDDIEKVKIATKNILHEAKDSNFVPRKYVLVTFSDQANLTTIKSTTDFQIMLTWLDEITVSGGDGCAEYAMTGILKGIEMSNNDSNIYFVTGADAKDVYLKQGVINGLKAKSLKLIAFLNDNCSRRRKRGADGQYYLSVNRGGSFQFHRVRRSSISVFEAIANATGGKVYETTTANVGEIVEKEIKDTFPSSNAFVTWFEIPATSTHDGKIFIPVDDYIKSLKIMVKNVFSLSELVCYYPNGTNVSFSLKNEKSDLSNNVLTISVKNPQPGQWKLEKKSAYSWVINVTAQSALGFTATILETSTDGNSYHLSGNPIKGNNYSVAVDIENLGTKSTCTSVALLDENGNDVTEIFVSRMYLIEIARYIGEFTPYNRSSYVQIRGTDDEGNPFLRTRPLFVMPVSVQLHISPLLGDLRLHDASNITFSLTNIGEDLLDFVITITDGYSDISVQRGSLDGGKIYGGIITITPTSLQTLTLDFLVTLENYTGIIQTEKRRYFVMDSRTAHCIVTEYPKICPTEALNTGNCTFYKWNGSVQVSSATIRESLIRVSTDNVILDHMNLTDSNFSVPILISGHCCIQTVVLSIIDKDGFFDQCSFTLSKQPLTIVQYHTTTEELTTLKEITSSHPATQDGHSKVIGISIGVSVLGVILMTIIVCIVRNVKVRCRQKTPVELSNYRSLERKEMETTEDLEIQSERQNLLIVDVTPGINENEDGNDSNSVNVSYSKKEEPKTAEKQKSSSKSSDYVNEETDTSSEAATTQKLQSPMKDPEKCFETKVVSESSVCPNEQTNNEDDTIVISGRRGHKEIRETGIL